MYDNNSLEGIYKASK